MSERITRMRLHSQYAGPENAITELSVEQFLDDAWAPLELTIRSPGFDIYTYSVLTCQHTYFRLNCAENGLLLNSAVGEIAITLADDWKMLGIRVEISAKLKSGTATQEIKDYILSRMQHCPVSVNTSPTGNDVTIISFVE